MNRVSGFFMLLLCFTPSAVIAQTATTELISIDGTGAQGNSVSSEPAISANGRFVAFTSMATNLIPGGDANGSARDIFLRDRITGTTELISVSSDGIQGNANSLYPSVSADGRYVAFTSFSSNLVPDDIPVANIYVRDRAAGTTELISRNDLGEPGNFYSLQPAISADGRFIAYYSAASNLVSGGDANGPTLDVFVYDQSTGATELVSVSSSGVQGNFWSLTPSISADGRFVAFFSAATNFIPGGDANGTRQDIFVRDRLYGTTTVASVNSDGVQGNDFSLRPIISADGRFVAFYSGATNLIPGGDANGPIFDAFIHDRKSGATELVSVDNMGVQANYHSYASAVSADGRYVLFDSRSENLIPNGDANGNATDTFIRDRILGRTELVSVSPSGEQQNSWSATSLGKSMSADGRFVAFYSRSTNLIPAGDANGFVLDVFVRDRGAPLNVPPVANAGPDQQVACTDPVATAVTLDGSNSYDYEGDPLSYQWSGPFTGGIASGVDPSVTLPFGISTVVLVVNDGQDDSSPDSVAVTVTGQVEGFMAPLPALVPSPQTPPEPKVAFKAGQTLPLKLKLMCGSRVLTDADIAPPIIYSISNLGITTNAIELVVLDAGASNDNGRDFRYSSEGYWVFNFSTASRSPGNTYRLRIQTPDGVLYQTDIALK